MGRRKRLPKVLELEEVEALLEQPTPRYPTGERNLTMLLLMLDAGLRLSEATALEWRNITLNTGKLLVEEGKVAKDRTVWITNPESNDPEVYEWEKKVMPWILSWKERQAEEIGKCNYVFTTLEGDPINNRYVRKMVQRYAEKAGIQEEYGPEIKRTQNQGNQELEIRYHKKKVGPHTLRHTFATNLYRRTNDIRRVQKALGHADISTTMIYTHIVDKDLEDAMRGNFQNPGRSAG